MPTLPSKADQATFAALVMDRFRQKGWTGPLTYLADDFSLELGDKVGRAFLGNIYQDWLEADEADKVKTIDKLVDASLMVAQQQERFTHYEAVAANLLPAIRARSYVANMWLSFDPASRDKTSQVFEIPSFRLSDDLSILVAIDTPDALGFVGPTQLKAWNKTLDQVYETAMINLRQKAKPRFDAIQPGLFTAEGIDFYQSSLLLLPDIFKAADIKGDIVAVPVVRNCLLVAGTRDDKALAAMARIAEGTYAHEARPLSLAPLILKAGAWVSYDAPEGQLPMLDRLRLKARAAEYSDQKHQLDAYFAKAGRETFVAAIEAIEVERGRMLTFTTLSSGVPVLLPQAQVVVIAPPDMAQPFARRWEDVVAVFGAPSLEPNTWPPRYQFSGRMDAGKLAKLKALPEAPDFPKLSPE